MHDAMGFIQSCKMAATYLLLLSKSSWIAFSGWLTNWLMLLQPSEPAGLGAAALLAARPAVAAAILLLGSGRAASLADDMFPSMKEFQIGGLLCSRKPSGCLCT
jgi:hypothetical protein